MSGIFELFIDAQSQYRFRLRASGGTELALSKGFEDKSAAVAGILAVRECAGTGHITDSCGDGPSTPELQVDRIEPDFVMAAEAVKPVHKSVFSGHRIRVSPFGTE